MSLRLLFVLPDKTNQKILAIKTKDKYCLPEYEAHVNEDILLGAVPQLADIPQLYNDFFKNLTGISVFRKYMFSTDKSMIFFCEQADEINNAPANGYYWISYDEIWDDELKIIVDSVNRDYNKHDGFTSYLVWLRSICADKNIHIIGNIEQTKSGIYRIPSSIGNLYLKRVGGAYSELAFTHKLLELGVPNLPEWVGCNPSLNIMLMRDMRGQDLSSKTAMNMEDLLNLAVALARTQKSSVAYVKSADFYGYDYRIGATINDLMRFPEDVHEMLLGTQYELTLDEKKKLAHNTECVIAMLKSIDSAGLPDTIHNSDMADYNVRCVDDNYIFYDWDWGGAAHPFFNMSRLLHSIERLLPSDIPAKEIIIDAYLREWVEYASIEELKRIFSIVDRLLGFSVMFFLKYVRTKPSYSERYKNFSLYLKRFINFSNF